VIDDLTYAHVERIHLIWVAVAFIALLAWIELRGRSALGRFLSRIMQHRLAHQSTPQRRIARLGLIAATLIIGVVALMRPQTAPATETIAAARVSADIVVVLDVSKSMLAEDAAPTRLARAKAEIGAMLGELRGHRIGLVAFAGRAQVLCPLTSDYNFFRLILRGVDTRSVARGGTRIGDALRKGVETFGPGSGARLILLITDGEDHESYPMDAARKALDAGVRIVSVGFGSEEGSQITLVDPDTGARSTVLDNNKTPVVSRLDGKLLREVALLTEGAYVPAGTAALDLQSIVASHIQPIVRESADTSVRVIPGDLYPWFVLSALICLCAAVWLGSTVGRRTAQ